MPLQFALISESTKVRARDLYWVARLAEVGARDCALAHHREPPAVDVFEDRRKIPIGNPNIVPVLFVDKGTDPTVGAQHYYDPVRRAPAARVYCETAKGVLSGEDCLLARAVHEIDETICDPQLNIWLPCPGRYGIDMAYEICDMVQTTYEVEYKGTLGSVANFTTPWYFDEVLLKEPRYLADLFARGEKLDHNGELTRPGQIGPSGYAILRQRKPSGGWDVWPEDAFGRRQEWTDDQLAAKTFFGSRTLARGAAGAPPLPLPVPA